MRVKALAQVGILTAAAIAIWQVVWNEGRPIRISVFGPTNIEDGFIGQCQVFLNLSEAYTKFVL